MSITGRGVQEMKTRHAKHLIAHFMCPFRFVLEPEHGIVVVIPFRAEGEPDVTVFDINESIAVHLLNSVLGPDIIRYLFDLDTSEGFVIEVVVAI